MSLDNIIKTITFIKTFLGKEGGVMINTHIISHNKGLIKPLEEDIWVLGEIERPITFDDIEEFIEKVQKLVKKYQKKGTYWFEGIELVDDPTKKYRARFCWGT